MPQVKVIEKSIAPKKEIPSIIPTFKIIKKQNNTEFKKASEFSVGQKLKHSRFGLGEITAIDGDPDMVKFTILFEDGSEKKLLERFANFTFLK